MMKNLFKNQEFQLDEILFRGRNKEYGAYVLRHEADQILTKSMFIGIGLFAAVTLTPFAVNSFRTADKVETSTASGPHILDNVDTPEVPEVVPPVLIPPKQVETFNSIVPTPKANVKKETPDATIDQYDKAVAGTQDIAGEKPTGSFQTPNAAGPAQTGPVAIPAPEPKVENPDAIAENVDVEAVFTGGINSFRNRVISNFETSDFEGSGETLKTTVTFIVERDGTISNIKANGPYASFNREAERTIKSVKGKWVPAKMKGQPVKSYFKFPVSMIFE